MCTCGKSEKHVIATRKTYDDVKIQLWSDGVVTSGMGFGLKGVGTPRTTKGLENALKAGWELLRIVELYEFREVGPVLKKLRKSYATGKSISVS